MLIKPIAPINSLPWEVTSGINKEVVEMMGWPDLVEKVATICDGLPEVEKPDAALLAGALDLYGPRYGLPLIISSANGL